MSSLVIAVIFLILIVIVSLVFFADDKVNDDSDVKSNRPKGDAILSEANRRVKHILAMSGYEGIKYRLRNNMEKSFTRNKEDVHVCTSCLADTSSDIPKLDRILYVSLHEVSHVINVTQDHDLAWEMVFKKLLSKACDLGYLDRSRLRI
jgi:hypothetical protein